MVIALESGLGACSSRSKRRGIKGPVLFVEEMKLEASLEHLALEAATPKRVPKNEANLISNVSHISFDVHTTQKHALVPARTSPCFVARAGSQGHSQRSKRSEIERSRAINGGLP